MFDSFKERIKRKSLSNAKRFELDGETVYFKKSSLWAIGDWNRIYPPVNEDGSWNIANLLFGGRRNAIKLIILALIIGLFAIGFSDLFKGCKDIAARPCEYCANYIKSLNSEARNDYWSKISNQTNESTQAFIEYYATMGVKDNVDS